MCLKGQCDGYLSQDPCYPRRTVRSKVISYILELRVLSWTEVSLVAKPPCKSLGRRNAPGAYGLASHWLLAGCWDWQKSVIHRYIALHAISTPEWVARGQGWERLSSIESSSQYAHRHQQRPAPQHAGEGALLCGENIPNRLREPLRQKDPIGHSSWDRGARSDLAPQYHLSKLLKWVSHCGKQVSPISHELSFHSGLALLTRAFFQ